MKFPWRKFFSWLGTTLLTAAAEKAVSEVTKKDEEKK